VLVRPSRVPDSGVNGKVVSYIYIGKKFLAKGEAFLNYMLAGRKKIDKMFRGKYFQQKS
jgi:hypothetical protein